MPINPLFSGLLWAAYLFCLLLSGVQSPYPATAVTGVYTTYEDSPNFNPLKSGYIGAYPSRRPHTDGSYLIAVANADDYAASTTYVRTALVFKTDGTSAGTRLAADTNNLKASMISPLLKHPMTLVTGQNAAEMFIYRFTIQETGPLFTLTAQTSSAVTGAERMLDVLDTNIAIVAVKNTIREIDILGTFGTSNKMTTDTNGLAGEISIRSAV